MKIKVFYFSLLLLTITTISYGFVNTNTIIMSSSFIFKGRVEKLTESSANLISPASSVTFTFKGLSAQYTLKSIDFWEHHNYFCLVVDGAYKGRFKIEKGNAQSFFVTANEDSNHIVTIYKATEAASGNIFFDGTSIKGLVPTSATSSKRIEFIGDSITCGAQSDASQTPCNQGEYFDQHNAYFAYGPVLSRRLNADFILSSVSGIGIYRNWNDENIEEPIMPQVYQNLHLNNDTTKLFDANYQPDIVSICLGTNDMSDGDGKKARLAFNKKKYTTNYINFIKTIFKRYPHTRIVLLSSPMISSDRNATIVSCLKDIIKAFKNDKIHKKIALFEFNTMHANGCTGHPNLDDHQIIASQLEPLFIKLINEK